MVLPELFTSGYQFVSKREVRELAEEIPKGPTTSRLIELARDRKMIIAAGLPERKRQAIFQLLCAGRPQGFITVYRKIHLSFMKRSSGSLPETSNSEFIISTVSGSE